VVKEEKSADQTVSPDICGDPLSFPTETGLALESRVLVAAL
jgi:hypothetical protein